MIRSCQLTCSILILQSRKACPRNSSPRRSQRWKRVQLVSLGGALEEVAKVSLDRFEANENDVRLMAGVIQSIKASLGSTTGMADKFEYPTLWGTTLGIADEVDRVGTGLIDLEIDMKSFKAIVTEMLQGSEIKDAKVASARLMEIVDMVVKRMKQISP